MKFVPGTVYHSGTSSVAYTCVYEDIDIVVFKFQYQGVQRGSVIQRHELPSHKFIPAGHRELTHKDF